MWFKMPDVRRVAFEIRDEQTMQILEQGSTVYVPGTGELHAAVDVPMQDVALGEAREFTIIPETGWGARDETARASFPRSRFEVTQPLKPGLAVAFPLANGQKQRMVIREVHPDHVVCDLNHPFAGRTLRVRAARVPTPVPALTSQYIPLPRPRLEH